MCHCNWILSRDIDLCISFCPFSFLLWSRWLTDPLELLPLDRKIETASSWSLCAFFLVMWSVPDVMEERNRTGEGECFWGQAKKETLIKVWEGREIGHTLRPPKGLIYDPVVDGERLSSLVSTLAVSRSLWQVRQQLSYRPRMNLVGVENSYSLGTGTLELAKGEVKQEVDLLVGWMLIEASVLSHQNFQPCATFTVSLNGA